MWAAFKLILRGSTKPGADLTTLTGERGSLFAKPVPGSALARPKEEEVKWGMVPELGAGSCREGFLQADLEEGGHLGEKWERLLRARESSRREHAKPRQRQEGRAAAPATGR